eukprot:TRINITY_DN388_c1_g2_i1.p1 TRINITY_DN388_c1_g2~~TRINITY_DN388_c1_g2_i1.p1  ORF type:complete len:669 (-),score=221.12 TRINITY_DN388_c1_g2_i1:479-2434(-)
MGEKQLKKPVKKDGAKKAQDGEEPKKGLKRKAESEDEEGEDEAEEAADKKEKKEKTLNAKQKKRKEVTTLYSELINPSETKGHAERVGQILELLEERGTLLSQYVSSEIGSHVMQACLKWGSKEQRRQILSKLKDSLCKAATNRYGHVVVLKLLRYCSRTATERKPTPEEKKEQQKNLREFLDAFKGKGVHSCFFQKYGCRVVNGIYFSEFVPTKDKRKILHDVAVAQSVALTVPQLNDGRTLRHILSAKELSEEHRKTVLTHLQECVDKAVDKELLGVDVIHELFQAFCERATETQLKDLADKCMAGCPHLLASKHGAEALLYLLGVANAKMRKAFCRDIKGKFIALSTNGADYLVMLRLLTTVDDTVMLQKSMIKEWLEDLKALVFDKYGHKVLAWLLRPDDSKFFSPYEREKLALPSPASVKAAETRRQELLRMLRGPIRAALMAEPLEVAADENAKKLLLAYLMEDWDAELVEALVAAAETAAASGEEELGGLGNNGTVPSTLVALLKLEDAGAATEALALQLWRRCFEPWLVKAATSRCASVLIGMLQRSDGTGAAVRRALRERRKEVQATVQKMEQAGGNVSLAKKLLAALDDVPASPKLKAASSPKLSPKQSPKTSPKTSPKQAPVSAGKPVSKIKKKKAGGKA